MSNPLECGFTEAEKTTVPLKAWLAEQLAQAIMQAQLVISETMPEHTASLANLDTLKKRLEEQRFHLAILGQFKRGKSTLLNALLGEVVLPVSVIPLTAIPTFVRPGDQRYARVVFNGGDSVEESKADTAEDLHLFLQQYVTEEANPENCLNVNYVEVFHPASILRAGVVLIDTPGIGSTHRHNTEATLNFIPQCDAALFVLSPDPPITEVETQFLKEVQERIGRIFFVLNKADYLGQSDREKVLKFLHSTLLEQAGSAADVSILPVSARLGLEARQQGSDSDWVSSGMRDVETLLLNFLVHEKESALSEAIARKSSDILRNVLLELRLTVKSLRMPLQELESRMESLKSIMAEAEARRTMEKDLLAGDQKRMAELLEEQAELLRRSATKRFMQVALEALEDNGLNTDLAQKALAEVIPVFFEHELGELSRVFQGQVRETLERHRLRTNELVESVRKTAAELFDIPYQPLASREEFEVRRQPYWVTHHWPVTLGVLPEGFWDRFLPRSLRRSRALQRMRQRIEVLVAENVENVRWPTLQNLQKSFHEFGCALDAHLEESVSATNGAIVVAFQKRLTQSAAVEFEVSRLESSIVEMERIDRYIRTCCGVNGNGG